LKDTLIVITEVSGTMKGGLVDGLLSAFVGYFICALLALTPLAIFRERSPIWANMSIVKMTARQANTREKRTPVEGRIEQRLQYADPDPTSQSNTPNDEVYCCS